MEHQQEILFMQEMLHLSTIKCMEEKLHITSNLGSGEEISIKRMVDTIIKVSGKDINVTWDTSKPNGEPRRRMNTSIQEKYGLSPKQVLKKE